MRRFHLFSLSIVFFLAACSTPPTPIVKKRSAPVLKENFIKVLEGNFRGQFNLVNGKGIFTTCDSNKDFPVNVKAGLRNIYEQINAGKDTPVYIEFTGEIAFSNASNSSSGVLMRIDRVHHMAQAKASLQCAKPVDTFRFKAKGEQPYWRLNINGQKLFFATKARNQLYQVQQANFQTTQINNVKSINTEGQRLNLTIQPNPCYNLKEKEYWGYSAKIDSIWGSFTGCGEPGWPVVEEKTEGYYLHKTASNVTNLTLNDDYTVEYHEKVGKSTTIKTGFWKTNYPQRIVVMLTQKDEQPIREEYIFTRKGLTLSSNKINKDNIVSYFPKPLTFNKMNQREGVEEVAIKRNERSFTTQKITPKSEVDLAVQKAVLQYFKIHRTDPKNTKFSSVKYDLNGDGLKEAIVLLDWCSTNGCEMLIFEGKESGYRFSSRVSRVHPPLTVARTQHYLWQSLLIEKSAQSFILDFDGISYPIHTRDLKAVNTQDYATGVSLFSQGTPIDWFPIQM